MDYEFLCFEQDGNVARVTLNRPDAANALDLQMTRELLHAAIRCDEDPEIRAVLLTGAGRMFCAGGDLKGFAAAGDGLPALLKEMTTYLHAAITRLARMDAPVIAAVNGMAAGGGLSLAVAADLVLAGASAKFTLAYTAAGLSPDGSSTYMLPRLIGLRRTRELMLTNRMLTADEAADIAMIDRVVPDDELMAEASKLAHELAAGPTRAYGAVKKLLHESFNDTLEGQMEREASAIVEMTKTADGSGGIAAFVAKQKPSFTGA